MYEWSEARNIQSIDDAAQSEDIDFEKFMIDELNMNDVDLLVVDED